SLHGADHLVDRARLLADRLASGPSRRRVDDALADLFSRHHRALSALGRRLAEHDLRRRSGAADAEPDRRRPRPAGAGHSRRRRRLACGLSRAEVGMNIFTADPTLAPYLALVLFGFLPSEIWRVIGVFVARRLDEESEIFLFVRSVATVLLV